MIERVTYTVEEAATLLGISRGSAYNLIRTGELRALRMGRRLVIPRVVLEELLGYVPPPRAEVAPEVPRLRPRSSRERAAG